MTFLTKHKTLLSDLLILAILLGSLFAFRLGSHPLAPPDEGRYSEIPREMVVTGDYVTPRLNGLKYFEKPPLVYWQQAFFIKHFGLSEWSLRAGNALFSLLLCLFCYFTAAKLYGRLSGIFSATILATTFLFYAMSRVVVLDMPFTMFFCSGLFCILLHLKTNIQSKVGGWLYGFYIFIALAILTKGLVAIALAGTILFLWLIVLKDWKFGFANLKTIFSFKALLLGLVVAVPWHVLVWCESPEFGHFYFYHEHFLRYLTSVHDRYKPFWFFIPILWLGLLPWNGFLFDAIKKAFKEFRLNQKETDSKILLLLLIWPAFIFVFFSVGNSKLIPYILPVFPPLCVLVGRFVASLWFEKNNQKFKRPFIIFGAQVAVLLLFLSTQFFESFYLFSRSQVIDTAFILIVLGCVLLFTFVAVARAFLKQKQKHFLLSLIAGSIVLCLVSNNLATYIQKPSVKNVALQIKPLLQENDEVIIYDSYFQDLPVYLERLVSIVNWKGELLFGTTVEDVAHRMMNEDAFWKRWGGSNRLYVFMKKQRFLKLIESKVFHYNVVKMDDNFVVLVNR